MRKLEKSKKDVLNVVLSILIMFLVGGCMTMILIVQSNSGTGRSPVMTNTIEDLSKDKRSLDFAPKRVKNETKTQNTNVVPCDTTESKEARTTKEDEASQ